MPFQQRNDWKENEQPKKKSPKITNNIFTINNNKKRLE